MNNSDIPWKNIVVAPNITVTEAINVLNDTGKMFLLVASENGAFLGILTDGDLRKGLLKFNNLSIPISKMMNSNPRTVSINTPRSDVISNFQSGNFKALPIVDENNILQGCYFETDFSKTFDAPNEMVIMAGGFGKRMGKLTKELPKPMLEVDGKPILEHTILAAKRQGFSKFYISVHYKSEKIITHFGDGKNLGVHIDYLKETDPLGTAGSIQLLPNGHNPVVITNADIISSVSFRALVDYHLLTNATATMGTHEHIIKNPFGVVHADGTRITKLEEKPVWKTNVNAGIYVINRSVSQYIEPNERIDMPEIFQRILDDGNLVIQYPIHEKIFEIGTLERYKNFIINPSDQRR